MNADRLKALPRAERAELQNEIEARYHTLVDAHESRRRRAFTLREQDALTLDSDGHERLRTRAATEVFAERDRAQAERQREHEAELRNLEPAIMRGNAAATVKWIERVAKFHSKRVVWRHQDAFEHGIVAFRRGNDIHLPIPEDGNAQRCLAVVAAAGHELGHTFVQCQGPDHFNERVGQWNGCLLCECMAWEKGLEFVPRAILADVHRAGGEALSVYTDSTPGVGEAFRRIEAFRSIGLKRELIRRWIEEIKQR
jgi:hypothetical protein